MHIGSAAIKAASCCAGYARENGMSASNAVAKTSETLRNLLVNEMIPGLTAPVTIQAPDEAGANRRINLFLFRIAPNTMLTNMDWQVQPGSNPTRLAPPPLSLRLFYLMTAYVPNDETTQNTAAQAVLGDAMRVFHENAVVPDTYLVNGLQNAREEIKITLYPMDADEMMRLWSMFSQPYRLSVAYEVTTVQIDMLPDHEREMAPRVRTVGVPQVDAPFHPPQVTHLFPTAGPPGTTITVHGHYFTGWRAYLRFSGQSLLEAQPIVAPDQFDFTIPGDAPTGFHEVRIDISHLHRSTLFIEVTAP